MPNQKFTLTHVFLGLTLAGGLLWTGNLARGQESATKARETQAAGSVLRVQGEIAAPLRLTIADLAQFPRQSVTAKAHNGKESRYEGVAVFEILKKAGVPTGKELRGKAVALYLVVEASDGYRAVFALPELDPAFNDRMILLADRRDGQPLSSHEGPFQIIVPGEKRHARWVRQVITLRIGRA
jgi:DMSO/TMAO reductase YedYZ molybdopterin-dependent catalytic subunit